MIEKAAANLATKGPELERKIREKNEDGRFNFLNPGDPYYAFYRFKYEEAKSGNGKERASSVSRTSANSLFFFFAVAPQANGHDQDQSQSAAPVAQQPASLAPKEPEPFEFSATMPSMSAQDL